MVLLFDSFTGRQAVANTVAGIYMLLPGAYLVSSFYTGSFDSTFITDVLKSAIIIGIGGWSGTILCSPMLLGGLLWQQHQKSGAGLRRGMSKEMNEGERPPLPREVGGNQNNLNTGTYHHHHHNHHRPRTSLWQSRKSPYSTNSQRGHRRDMSRGSGQLTNAAAATSAAADNHHHNRLESNISIFDFDDPKSTVLYF